LGRQVVTTNEELVKEAKKVCDVLTAAAPGAVAAAKKLVQSVQYKPITPELQAYTADQLSQARTTTPDAAHAPSPRRPPPHAAQAQA
jgi:enoyl-CoA hydratase/carnithine racemase